MKIDVALLPGTIKERDLSSTLCIVLDIFRATSSIVTALANGCEAILPALSIEHAQELAQQSGATLFAGERKSIRIAGYDFGNSPLEFSPEKVKGKQIVMTTTNGTNAIKSTEGAHRTLIGSFLNASAVCADAAASGKDILIVCAGTDGLFSLEDSLCAGLLTEKLAAMSETELTDAAQGVRLMYRAAQEDLVANAVPSRNGKRLQDLDLMDDVRYCLRQDALTVVPCYAQGVIR
jgi:2-phosphosulfolactate phosphatase